MEKKILNILALGLLLVSAGCSGDTSSSNKNTNSIAPSTSPVEVKTYWNATYANPVPVTTASGSNYNGEIADPSIVKGDDGYFYMVATNQRFLRSEDGCYWEVVTEQIIPTPKWGQQYSKPGEGYGLWAPDLIKIGDTWIYYYSLSGWGNAIGVGYATADNVAGPYTDQGKLFAGSEIGIDNCIDPQPFVDDDGKVYMTVGSFQGLYLLELTEDGTECLNGIQYQAENKILIAGYKGGWDGATYEGGYIVKKDGYYYYFGSAGTCCAGKDSTYRVFVGKSEDIAGPYRGKNNFTLTMSGKGKTYGELVCWAGSNDDRDVSAPGHNSILVDDAGDYWMYYHAYSSEDKFGTRHLFMDKLEWDEDGYPYVETLKPSFQEEKDGPRIEEVE